MSELLALLPPEAERHLRRIAEGDFALGAPDGAFEFAVAEQIGNVVAATLERFQFGVDERPVIAWLLVLLIQQARENAALRPLLEHPPTFRDYTGTDERTCGYCHAPLEGYSRGKDEHEPTCPWSVARARLLATPEPASDG